MNLSPVTRFAHRSALKIKKNSPRILFYSGLVGTVATTVLASRATLKAVPVVNQLADSRGLLEAAHDAGRVSDSDFQKEAGQQYAHAGMALTKLYGPVVIVGVTSIVCLTKSYQQLNARNTALTVAYTGLFKTFESYRERVRAELGDQGDQQFLHGTVVETKQIEGKDGKVKEKTVTSINPASQAAMSYYFDSGTSTWDADPSYNQNFLSGQESWANILLQKQGHLFLNEVYDLIGAPHTQEGQVLGWIYQNPGDHVTFGITDGEFIGGYKRDVMLNFNLSGVILDKI